MKVRSALNRVLRAVGSERIDCSTTTLENDYQIQVLEYLNQFKEEIEDAHNWRSLYYTSAGVYDPTSSAFGAGAAVSMANTNTRCRIARIQQQNASRLVPVVFDATDPTSPCALQEMDLNELHYRRIQDGTSAATATAPTYFAADASEPTTYRLWLYPTPAVERTIFARLIRPQDYLDVTSLDTHILIPQRALIIGTIWYVLQERGEEFGVGSLFTEENYRKALDAEIAKDSAESGDTHELVVV